MGSSKKIAQAKKGERKRKRRIHVGGQECDKKIKREERGGGGTWSSHKTIASQGARALKPYPYDTTACESVCVCPIGVNIIVHWTFAFHLDKGVRMMRVVCNPQFCGTTNTLAYPSSIKPLSTALGTHSCPFRPSPFLLVSLHSNAFGRFLHLKVAASASDDDVSNSEPEAYEEYEVEVEQPYGLKFAKGRDGATYIDAIAPGLSADKTGKFTVGDKVIATSAVFGTEIWPAAEYGRTMYTIRQRIGPLYMKMQKRFGNLDYGGTQLSEKEIIRAERNSGFISNRVREIQLQNYQRKMEQKQRRERELVEGLQLYKSGKYENAREKFESVLGSMPTPDEASVASYNVACCYSKLNQIQAGLSALEDALKQGYEDFKRIRTDPDLANLRTSADFETLLKRFDESFINENAVNAIKSLFGLFNKN